MPIDPAALLNGLKPVVTALEKDLLTRSADPGVDAALKVSWQKDKDASRTAAAFKLWKRRRCTQVAIAWVLSVVFVRTLEDRGFLARRRIAGPGARDSEQQFTALAPFLTPRDYLLTVFTELAKLPGAGALFDARHNPVWVLAPSADGARKLLDFLQQTDAAGALVHDFAGSDTRFLGDLYQNLSEDVRKRYALLQTPEFVEEFILEQTLDPAIEAFGLEEVRLIDPTCGSGHFLLGAFHRLFDAWLMAAPGEDRQVLAQRALAQVYGCDLNPYAVAIARFRLTLEFLQVAGIQRLELAPRLPLNLCVADSLLHGVVGQQQRLATAVADQAEKLSWGDRLFALEDEDEALRVLGQRYHVVVGNPPYITEKDAKKRAKYRDLYESAAGKFALAAPFTERFFGLAKESGCVGLINSNAFTKREFGRALIEKVLPKYEVTKIVDSSVVYVPGHGTPTLLLFGRNRPANHTDIVAVMGKRGQGEEPIDPACASAWSEVLGHHDDVGFDGYHLSTELIPREEIRSHPWILAGGGARDLLKRMERTSSSSLGVSAEGIGFDAILGADDAFLYPTSSPPLRGLSNDHMCPFIDGSAVSAWRAESRHMSLFPYCDPSRTNALPDICRTELDTLLWPFRTLLEARVYFGKTMSESGSRWYEYRYSSNRRGRGYPTIVFAEVSSQQRFVQADEKYVYGQTAPLISLNSDFPTEYIGPVVGFLNSSAVAFWSRLSFYFKAGGDLGPAAPWDRYLQFSGSRLSTLPMPSFNSLVKTLAHLVDAVKSVVREMRGLSPSQILVERILTENTDRASIVSAQKEAVERLCESDGVLVSLQEEMDWRVYGLYGLPTLTASSVEEVLVPVAPEHRPFEVRLAREVDDDLSAKIWFERHKRTPPADVGGPLAELYRQRLQLIEQHKELKLLETPETKRRWSPRDYKAEFQAAYRDWLLDCIESILEDQPQPVAMSARQIAAELQRDPKAQVVAEVYTDESAPDLERLVSGLVQDEGIPHVAALRFTDTGMEKHAAWRETWDLQRREDAGENVGEIHVPPKYATKDFRRSSYWTHRGKLDVPKERFVLYQGAETDTDSSPWLGWAGWDHLQRATALSGLYQQRKSEEGWEADKLLPLLAGLHELVPWLIQWHNEPDATYGGQRLGNFFRDFVGGEAHRMGHSTADLEAWRPPETKRRGGGGRRKGGGRKPKLTTETLLAAFQPGAERAQAELAEALGVSSVTVGKSAKACVEDGALIMTSGRPKRYRLP